MEDEKIISKLKWVVEECNREIEDSSSGVFTDLTAMLKKVVKNCETSMNLVKEYQTLKDQRSQAI